MRRYLAMLLCILLVTGCARAAVSVRMENSAALLDEDGGVIVAPGTYQDIISLGGELFAAETGGRYALMDASGALRTEAVYGELKLRDGRILARRDGKWGLLNADGSVRAPFEYSLIIPGPSGNCWALLGDPNDLDSDKLYRIDPEGERHATRLYVRDIGGVSEGLLSVMLRGDSAYGYCDALGRMTVEARFDHAGEFVNGVAAVVENGSFGAVDRSGAWIVPAEYDFLEITASGLILAAKDRESARVFDPEGRELAAFGGEDVYIASVGDGFAVVDAEFLHVYSEDGRLMLEAPPDTLVLEGVNGQLIVSDGMWGEECVFLDGADRRYQNLYPLGSSGGEAIYAYMQAGVGRYMNDRLGEIQLSVDMESARYGIAGADGEMLTAAEWISLEYLADDRLLARTKEAWQMIDAEGNVLWEHAAE